MPRYKNSSTNPFRKSTNPYNTDPYKPSVPTGLSDTIKTTNDSIPAKPKRLRLRLLKQIIDRIYWHCKKNDYDVPIVIAGDEGKGKTNLALWILDDYIERVTKRATKPKDIKYLALAKEQWKEQLGQLRQYFPLCYDEAGELTNRRAMARFNVEIAQLFRIIRGNNNFMILNIQSIFDLDPFFTKRRLKGMFYVDKRGHYYFYSQERLRILIDINSRYYVKQYFAIMPTAAGSFPKYDGVLLDPYLEKKKAFIKEQQGEIMKSLNTQPKDRKRKKKARENDN